MAKGYVWKNLMFMQRNPIESITTNYCYPFSNSTYSLMVATIDIVKKLRETKIVFCLSACMLCVALYMNEWVSDVKNKKKKKRRRRSRREEEEVVAENIEHRLTTIDIFFAGCAKKFIFLLQYLFLFIVLHRVTTWKH